MMIFSISIHILNHICGLQVYCSIQVYYSILGHLIRMIKAVDRKVGLLCDTTNIFSMLRMVS